MKWLLVIVVLTAEGDKSPLQPIPYPDEPACWEAAERFVAHHPKFELRRPGDAGEESPVSRSEQRSYVECVAEARLTPEL